MEENNNVIQKFTLTKEGNEVLSFVRCDSEEIPEGYVPVTMSESSEEELMNGFSSAIGAAIPSAIVSQATSGLYQATVNPAMLMTLEDGTKSTAIMIDGRITGHAGFKPVSAKVFTPSIIFQVLSFFTGHYYLNGISKQLEALQVSINELRKDLEFEKQATLKAAYDRLKRLFVSSVNTIDELSLIQHIEYDMVDKYHFYLSKIEECNDAFIEKTKRVNKFRKDMIQAKAVIEESDELAYYRRMCLDAYRLIMISKLVYLKALASVSMYHKEFIPKITEVLNSLEKDNEDFIEKIYVSYLKRINLIDDSLKNANELQFAGYVVSSIMKQVKK